MNPQGMLTHTRLFSKQLPSPVGLPFHFYRAAVAGIEPAPRRLTAVSPYQHRPHRIIFQHFGRVIERRCLEAEPQLGTDQLFQSIQVRTAGFEPAISYSRRTRISRLSHVLIDRAPSGSRTRTSAMARQQATATSWTLMSRLVVKEHEEHQVGFEPTLPQYECGVLAAGRPVRGKMLIK